MSVTIGLIEIVRFAVDAIIASEPPPVVIYDGRRRSPNTSRLIPHTEAETPSRDTHARALALHMSKRSFSSQRALAALWWLRRAYGLKTLPTSNFQWGCTGMMSIGTRSADGNSSAWGLRIVATVATALIWLSICLGSAISAKTPDAVATFDISTSAASRDAYRMLDVPFNRAPTFAANVERVRWLPTMMPPDRVEVNTATALLQLFRNHVPVFTTRVIVGGRGRQTPEFEASIESILFNPSWYVPPSIATSEILPRVRTNPGYLRRHNMVIRNGSVVQLPGPDNALGQLKFEMPNAYDVYLHDTPLKHLFSLNDRRQSHGCVRVQNPRQLAALLLQEPIEAINTAIALGYTHRRFLANPMPVFIFYGTIFPASGLAGLEDVPVC